MLGGLTLYMWILTCCVCEASSGRWVNTLHTDINNIQQVNMFAYFGINMKNLYKPETGVQIKFGPVVGS